METGVGQARSTRQDTTELARKLRAKAQQLEKMSVSAADAVDSPQPRPMAESGKDAPDGNQINDILRATMRILTRVEGNLSDIHLRLGNPFAERAVAEEVG